MPFSARRGPGAREVPNTGGGDRRPGTLERGSSLCGTLSQLVSYTGFAVVLFSRPAVSCVFVLRRRDPHAPRPFRAWGIPGARDLRRACAAMVVNEMIRNGPTALAGVAVIARGRAVVLLLRARQHRDAAAGV